MGIIGDALTGFAQGAATGYVQNIEAEIEALKQETILEKREAMRVKGRQSDADQDIANLPKMSAAKRVEANLDADNTIANKERLAPRTRALASDDAVAANQSAADITIANAGNKGLMSAQRTIKQNEHIESPASRAQAALAGFQLDRAKLVAGAQDALSTAEQSKNPEAIESARKTLTALNSKGESPKDAATLMNMSRAYLNAAEKSDDIEEKKDFTTKANVFGNLALKEMGMEGKGGGTGTIPPMPPKQGSAAPQPKVSAPGKPDASGGDFYILKDQADALDAKLERATKQMNDAQTRNDRAGKQAAIETLQALGAERSAIEAKMNAIRQRDKR